ncbi:hypothetical protein AMAG_14289 [Allomyces macrogynus ATCC 38327]|uniref:FAD/NAD(P)-binding domain-containing protein n=1 Tax=Allomyces macrogynus (strain ATCC 38327) TaxID=578462 RepID=A0A0L0T4K2_ALLM3|nr:hypothetical protein AMAG_14289 [Allomyces macrogynus ATCC 38327]|eukprot:KNE69748.1 hypothetical protein AMAG_14289 [Allomyces macrogynus ATCC 38327]
MTVHPPALPSTPAPVPASMLPLGTLIPDNVATFVLGYVDAVYKDHVLLQSSAPGAAAAGTAAAAANDVLVGKRIPFDYCVLATGSSYASSVKAANISSTYRARKLQYDYAKLAKARTVLVIGGGSVGVEIASEIASVFGTPRVPVPPESTSSTTPTPSSGTRSTSPSPFRRGSASTTATRATSPPVVKHPVKRIILVDANPRLLKRCPPRASQKALAYMRDVLGIDVVLGERITHHDARAGVFRARSGREFRADVVYLATGPVPQTQCMEPAFAHLLTGPNPAVMPSASTAPHHVDDAARASSTSNFFVGAGATAADAAAAGHMVPRRVLVRATHQIPTLPHIFVGGDCCATAEEKMALTAQCAAITIRAQYCALVQEASLD